jgi:hypothetical protein
MVVAVARNGRVTLSNPVGIRDFFLEVPFSIVKTMSQNDLFEIMGSLEILSSPPMNRDNNVR